MAHPTAADADVDLHAIARDLSETDALTPNDGETLHPDYYVVDAENMTYLVETVLTLAAQHSEASGGRCAPTAPTHASAAPGASPSSAGSDDEGADDGTGAGEGTEGATVRAVVAEALRQSWLAVHVERFAHDEGTAEGPDNFYNGMLHARAILDQRVAATLDGTLPVPVPESSH